MSAITASQVKELREETNVGMMECKKALVEANGDKEQAVKILRERGLATAGKKASRTAKEGQVASEISDGGKTGVIVEINCETDFVSRNEIFQKFVKEVVQKAKEVDGELGEAIKDDVTAKIQEIGENIIARRHTKFEAQGPGIIASYIHLGGKVGVLLEVGCEKEETEANDIFKELVKDITLHIAASSPRFLTREEVPEAALSEEKEIFAKQAEGKPANIIDKIVAGKLEKYYSQICLVEQGFVKDPDQSISELLTAKGKELGDTLVIRRFARYQVGEEV